MKGSKIWLLKIHQRGSGPAPTVSYGPWVFGSEAKAHAFACRVFSAPLVAWLDSLPYSFNGARYGYQALIACDYERLLEAQNFYASHCAFKTHEPYWFWSLHAQNLNPTGLAPKDFKELESKLKRHDYD